MQPSLILLALLIACGQIRLAHRLPATMPTPPIVVADGNSLVRGSCASTLEKTYPADLAAAGFNVRNAGVGSQTTEGMAATAATNVDPYYQPGGLVVAWEGHNSWRILFDTPAAAYAAMASYIGARHAVGWRVMVMTAIAGAEAGDPAGWPEWMAAYNALVLANGADADGTIDLGDPRLADPESPYFCPADHVHLSDEGYAVVAEIVANALGRAKE